VDDWMQTPGAWVLGHRAVVRGSEGDCRAVCTCGYQSQVTASLDNTCFVLVDHLQQAVRGGAKVMGRDDGPSGVREPRRPLRPLGSSGAELDVG
jgi:hypothetical protein